MKKTHGFIITAVALLGASFGISSCSFAQPTEKQVRFQTPDKKFIGTVSGGKLLEITSRRGEQQLFTLIDLNGGDLADGDAVQVKYVPGTPPDGGTASPPNFWQAREAKLLRGSEPDTFTVKKLGDAYAFRTPAGKYVADPARGKGTPTLADAEADALKLTILFPNAAPASASSAPATAASTAPVTRTVPVEPPPADGKSIADFGAVGDGKTLNTEKIQKAINQVAARGGTIVIPQGVFLSGAIFLKPGVNLYLAEGATLKGSTNIADYPKRKTRIEGHFTDWIPALVNADKCDKLRITGAGVLDGSGAPFWKEFWDRRKADPQVTNLAVERPRLALIQNSQDVQIRGITFKDSGFWNLHLYRCQNVLVENARFEVPNGVRCPSTDGTDIDSSQDVTIRGCTYRVDDDCVALKGSKGPFALDDKDSPPVERIRVENCTFERGNGVVTLGSEATIVRDVVVENCTVTGRVNIATLKLRGDTPQHYEDIHYRNITLDNSTGIFLNVHPWKQFFDLKGQQPPKSVVKNVTMSNIKGQHGSFGTLQGNSGQTEISDITLKDIDVQLQNERLRIGDVKNLKIENVTVNGKPFSR